MSKKIEYYQITDEEVKEIIKDLMKKCETHPNDIAEYIDRNGNVIGQIYNIKYNLNEIDKYEKTKNDVEGFVKFYKQQYGKNPSKQQIKEQMDFYQEQIDYYKKELQHYLISDSVFYGMKCKVLKYNTENYDKIFTPEQVELIYKAVEKYVVDNKMANVLFAKIEYKDSCIKGIEKKYLPIICDLIFEKCDLKKSLKIFAQTTGELSNINFETNLKDKVIQEGKLDAYYDYLLTASNIFSYKKNSEEEKQHKKNNQEVADKIFEYIKVTKDKKTCRKIMLGLNNNGKSDDHARNIVEYFDKRELLKMYIDFCSKKEIENFIDEIASNKYSAEHPPINDDIELC